MREKTAQNYLYGFKAAQRIFSDKEIKKLEVFTNCILIVFEKGYGSPKFVSKNVFKKHFADFRKESAKQCYVSYDPLLGWFNAPASHNIQESYRIELFPDRLSCTCGDWKTQLELGFAKPTCKHCYAALNYIGFNSLRDYVESKGIEFLDHNTQYAGVSESMRQMHQEAMADPF